MSRFRDLPGQTFGRLTVVERICSDKQGRMRWRCSCACGGSHESLGTHLLSGNTSSCGCLKSETSAAIHKRHGHAVHGNRSPEYRVWTGIRTRCSNPRCEQFGRYGGRGIRLCERWAVYENFLSDMGPRPSLLHSIERKDNDGHYEPSNCHWATPKEQANNRRKPEPRMTEPKRRELVALRLTGVRVKDLAAKFGITPTYVCRLVKQHRAAGHAS